jgi:hypothetical protein
MTIPDKVMVPVGVIVQCGLLAYGRLNEGGSREALCLMRSILCFTCRVVDGELARHLIEEVGPRVPHRNAMLSRTLRYAPIYVRRRTSTAGSSTPAVSLRPRCSARDPRDCFDAAWCSSPCDPSRQHSNTLSGWPVKLRERHTIQPTIRIFSIFPCYSVNQAGRPSAIACWWNGASLPLLRVTPNSRPP